MISRIAGSVGFGLAVSLAAAVLVLIARLLGNEFGPVLFIGFVAGVAVFIIDLLST